MKPRIFHALAGAIALLTILAFWVSTLVAELFLAESSIMAAKQAILYGMALLVPSIALTGLSGAVLARPRSGPLAQRKAARMRIIAANGLLIMVPASLYLYGKASLRQMDGGFYTVQAVELLVGAVQLFLMGRNFRDGLRLAGRVRPAGSEKEQRA
jgi:hypothetical protein